MRACYRASNRTLLEAGAFDGPKPVGLMRRLLTLAPDTRVKVI